MALHELFFPVVKDTYIDASSPFTNYGSSDTLIITRGSVTKQAYMGLDLSTIPPHKKIIMAKLYAYLTYRYQSSDTGPVVIRALSDELNMSESEITYSYSPRDVSHSWEDNSYDRFLFPANEVDVYGEALILNKINEAYALGINKIWMWIILDMAADYPVHLASKETANGAYLEITYEDVPPNAPTPTEPIGLYKDSKSIIRFAWTYNSDVGGVQKKFDLQHSTDQTNWTTVSETTENNYYDMPADTFSGGNVYWRVRTYNEYDEVGPYCDIQSFYAIGAPAAPMLNAIPANSARPVVSWSAFSQQVYQLQVLSGDTIVYNSGVVPGINMRQHKIKAWLADGEYTVRIRIKNEYDLWSEWGSAAVTITTVKPDKPTLSLQRSAYGIEISATGIVYRSDYDKDDYICIGTASGTYFDNTVRSKGEYKYFVRAVSEDDTFADSDVKFIQAEFRHALIAPISDLTNIFVFSRSLNSPPKRTYNRQPGGASVQYAGRKSPVWEPTEHVSTGWSMTFFLKTWAEVETFTAIYDLNSTVLYRDAKGRKMYGTLSNLSVNDDILGYIISFTLSQVDHSEVLEV